MTGLLVLEEILRGQKTLEVTDGANTEAFSIEQLRKRVSISRIDFDGMSPFHLRLRVDGNRVLISDTFRYVENKEIVGIIDDNHWALFKDNILMQYSDDHNLEVADRQGFLVLGLYLKGTVLTLRGYVIGKRNLYVLDNGMYIFSLDSLSDHEKQDARDRLGSVKPRFLSPKDFF